MGRSKNRRKKPRKRPRTQGARRTIQAADAPVKVVLSGLVDRLAELPLGPCFVTENWQEEGALVSACITRLLAGGKLVAIVFLVDLACLGVKDLLVKKLTEAELTKFLSKLSPPPFEPCDAALAVKIIATGVEYAAQFDLHPVPEYELARHIFGNINPAESDEIIRTGIKGKPCYISGPHDDVDAIIAYLMERLGPDGFHFITPVDPLTGRFKNRP